MSAARDDPSVPAPRLRPRLAPDGLPMGILLTSLVALTPFAIDMFLPSMPAMAVGFGVPPVQVQLAVTLFLLSYAFSHLVYGPLSDRYGRRGVLLGGLGVFTLAGLVCAATTSIHMLIAARVLQGFAAGAAPVIARAVVRDVYEPQRGARVFAHMATAVALAPTLAPIVGGFLQVWVGWRSVFFALAGLGALVLGAGWLGLPETNRFRDPDALRPGRMLRNFRALATHRAFMGYALVLALVFGGQFTFISGSSFVLIDLIGVSPDVYGFCFGLVAFGFMTGAFLTGRLTGRWGVDRMILTGGAVSGGAGVALAALGWLGLAPGFWGVAGIVAPMYLYAVGGGMIMPSAMAGAIGPFPRMAGLASALAGFMQMIVAAGYSMAVGALYDGTAVPMTLGIGIAGVGALLVFMLIGPYRHPRVSDAPSAQPAPSGPPTRTFEGARGAVGLPTPEIQARVLEAARTALGDAALTLETLGDAWARHIGPDEIVRGRLLAALQPRLPIRIPPGDAVNFATLDDAL
ncbi:MAG: multidrug effflux MFS transporter, partial [Candidatus Lambdaproteobacteria bacterium]|nr:multidrug effflux MFS transporter [Candidatus Lambdaproteobacteria bacterium]